MCVGAQPMSWDNFGEMRLTIHIYVCGMAPPFSGEHTPCLPEWTGATRTGIASGNAETMMRHASSSKSRVPTCGRSPHMGEREIIMTLGANGFFAQVGQGCPPLLSRRLFHHLQENAHAMRRRLHDARVTVVKLRPVAQMLLGYMVVHAQVRVQIVKHDG